jgi:signal transduction histidine kinase
VTQRQRWVDIAVTAAVAVVTGMDVWWSAPGTRPADRLSYGLLVLSLAAVLVRRRWPLAVTLICGLVLTAWTLLGHRGELLNLPTMVGLFTMAAQGSRRRTVGIGVVAVAWSALLGWYAAGWSSAPVAEIVWPVAALLLGEVVRGRAELRREYADREARAVADRVQQERVRIAREVHDVVAHTMAAVNVQMGVAVTAFDQRPEAARAALRQARTASRDALRELRAAVGLLRDSPEAGPTPRLDGLPQLVDRTRAAGLDVTLHLNLGADRLTGVLEATAYRIVQEALTNVVRHAGARNVTVMVCADGSQLTVEVCDDGRGGPVDGDRSGFGRTGMAERAAAVGGRLESGPVDGGGFRVRAVLPIGGDA